MEKKVKFDEYYKKFFLLLDKLRSTESYPYDAALRAILQEDSDGKFELFSKDEYKDPLFIQALKSIILSRQPGISIPYPLVDFVHKFTNGGSNLFLYSGIGDALLSFDNITGVELNVNAVEWAKFISKITEVSLEVVATDPLTYTSEKQYDFVISIPPFNPRGNIEEIILTKIKDYLKPDGKIFIVFPEGILMGGHHQKLREKVMTQYHINAVISLPSDTFQPQTGIKSSLLILESHANKKVSYLVQSKSLNDLDKVASDYESWSKGKKYTVGFESTLSNQRWDVRYYEPIDFEIGKLEFPYKIVKLEEVAEVIRGEQEEDAKIAINKTGSKVVLTDEVDNLIEKNNLYIKTKDIINPIYLYQYLNSVIGKEALGKCIKGATIPYIVQSDLLEIPIILPDLKKQNEIVENVLEMTKTITALSSLSNEGQKAIKENLFDLKQATNKFKAFSNATQEAYYQSLPFPIAITYRKITNATNYTQKFTLMIELFEVAIRYVALINLSDYLYRQRKDADIQTDIPLIHRIERPSLGDWIQIFEALINSKSQPDITPFVTEIKDFNLRKFHKILEEFVQIRNTSLRGHGGTLDEDEYQIKFQEYFPKLEELIKALEFLNDYKLVKVERMDKDGDLYNLHMKELMGDNPVFPVKEVSVRNPIDTNKVILMNSELEYLVLEPFLVLTPCPECHRNEALLFDKFNESKISYYSCEGHRPVGFNNVDKLPLIIKNLIYH